MPSSPFNGFAPEAVTFFTGLAENNTRAYFTDHRDVYDRAIRGPLEALTAEAQEKYGPGKVTRPNRDVRFSVDKTPYRLTAAMWVRSVGGVYLQFSANGIEAGGGLYEPTRDQLGRGRAAISSQPLAAARVRGILDDLAAQGFEVAGPSLKTTPKGYEKDDPQIELLRLKHYAALRRLPVDADADAIRAAWTAIEPLIAWVGEWVGPALSWP